MTLRMRLRMKKWRKQKCGSELFETVLLCHGLQKELRRSNKLIFFIQTASWETDTCQDKHVV